MAKFKVKAMLGHRNRTFHALLNELTPQSIFKGFESRDFNQRLPLVILPEYTKTSRGTYAADQARLGDRS